MGTKSHQLRSTLDPALSLIVDGREILEAIIIDYKNNIVRCFPCNISVTKIHSIIKLTNLMNITGKRLLENYIVVNIGKSKAIIFPLKRGTLLVLFIRPGLDAHRIALNMLHVLDRIKNISRANTPPCSHKR